MLFDDHASTALTSAIDDGAADDGAPLSQPMGGQADADGMVAFFRDAVEWNPLPGRRVEQPGVEQTEANGVDPKRDVDGCCGKARRSGEERQLCGGRITARGDVPRWLGRTGDGSDGAPAGGA